MATDLAAHSVVVVVTADTVVDAAVIAITTKSTDLKNPRKRVLFLLLDNYAALNVG